jgi:hypothetical protein
MAINQLSTSNTFQQWLSATQILIEKSNYFETTTNTVFNTANTVYQTANNVSNTANAFYLYNTVAYNQSNAAFAQANSALSISIQANAASIIAFAASNNAYAAANAALAFANSASSTSNVAFGIANAAFSHANAAFNFANTANSYAASAFVRANLAYTYANSTLAVVENANNTISNGVISINGAYAAANLFLGYVANNSNLALMQNSNTDNNMYVLFSANTGVLVEANISEGKLYYNPFTGTLNATNLNSLSDREFKKNIIHIDNSIEVLQQIDGVEFQWVDSDKKSYGVIAQELEKILPELVEGTTKKSVNYSGLIAFLINAVKTLDNRVTELEKVINKQ